MTTSTATALRRAARRDSAELATIWYLGWRDGHFGHVPAAVLPHRRLADFRRRVPAQIADTTVATADSRVVGFVTVRGDEVEQLYVAEAARGTGVAATLLDHGERAVGAAHGRAWLAVAGGNTRARRFYERHGWKDDGPLYYAAGTAGGGTVVVPSRRYVKQVSSR